MLVRGGMESKAVDKSKVGVAYDGEVVLSAPPHTHHFLLHHQAVCFFSLRFYFIF